MHPAHTLRFAVGHLGETRCMAFALGESERAARVGAFVFFRGSPAWCVLRKIEARPPLPFSIRLLDVFVFSISGWYRFPSLRLRC